MKTIKLFILILLITFTTPQFCQAQKSEKARITKIEQEITKAVEQGNYEKAATLQKEKETLEAVVIALENGNYEKAAQLKKSLASNGSSVDGLANTQEKLAKVEANISGAVSNGNYEEAAQLKKEKEILEKLITAYEVGDSEKIAELQNKLSNESGSSGSHEISPEFVNQVYAWDKTANELTSLEKQKGEIKTSSSASPFHAKSTSFYKVDGKYSPLRNNTNISYVIKVVGGQDPRDLVSLITFQPGKDGEDRYMPYFEASGYAYGGSSGEVKDVKLPISIKKVNAQTYEIIPVTELKNGEYGFKVIDKFYCFGIGPKNETNIESVNNAEPPHDNRVAGSYTLASTGYYMDLMLGFGSSSATSLNFSPGLKMGVKFLKNKDRAFTPGFCLPFARMQFGLNGNGFNWVNLSLVGVGFTSIIAFTDKTGLEINANAMFNIHMIGTSTSNDDGPFAGVLINPDVKFRYKSFAVGIDISYSIGGSEFSIGPRSTFIAAASIGLKF